MIGGIPVPLCAAHLGGTRPADRLRPGCCAREASATRVGDGTGPCSLHRLRSGGRVGLAGGHASAGSQPGFGRVARTASADQASRLGATVRGLAGTLGFGQVGLQRLQGISSDSSRTAQSRCSRTSRRPRSSRGHRDPHCEVRLRHREDLASVGPPSAHHPSGRHRSQEPCSQELRSLERRRQNRERRTRRTARGKRTRREPPPTRPHTGPRSGGTARQLRCTRRGQLLAACFGKSHGLNEPLRRNGRDVQGWNSSGTRLQLTPPHDAARLRDAVRVRGHLGGSRKGLAAHRQLPATSVVVTPSGVVRPRFSGGRREGGTETS